MNEIKIQHLLPGFISDTASTVSEIWFEEVRFEKGTGYLVTATSGAGKSSLLSYIFGERADYKGIISFDNKNIHTLNVQEWHEIRKNKMSFVFQGLRLFSGLTVWENIAIKNRLTGHKTETEIDEMLADAGLSDKKNETAAKLSFGQQQRVAIIRALCQPFDFLLLDEPFSHLDDANITSLSTLILKEVQANEAGMILCSLGSPYSFTYKQVLKL